VPLPRGFVSSWLAPLSASSLLVARQISSIYNTAEHVGVGVTLYTQAHFQFRRARIANLVWAPSYDWIIRVTNFFSKRRSPSLLFIGYRGPFLGVKLPEREVYICYTDWSFSFVCLVSPGQLGDSSRLKYSGMWHCVPWGVVPEMPSSSGPNSPNSLRLLSHKEESPIILRNAGNSSIHMTSLSKDLSLRRHFCGNVKSRRGGITLPCDGFRNKFLSNAVLYSFLYYFWSSTASNNRRPNL